MIENILQNYFINGLNPIAKCKPLSGELYIHENNRGIGEMSVLQKKKDGGKER